MFDEIRRKLYRFKDLRFIALPLYFELIFASLP